jgi:hypothetical protein
LSVLGEWPVFYHDSCDSPYNLILVGFGRIWCGFSAFGGGWEYATDLIFRRKRTQKENSPQGPGARARGSGGVRESGTGVSRSKTLRAEGG